MVMAKPFTTLTTFVLFFAFAMTGRTQETSSPKKQQLIHELLTIVDLKKQFGRAQYQQGLDKIFSTSESALQSTATKLYERDPQLQQLPREEFEQIFVEHGQRLAKRLLDLQIEQFDALTEEVTVRVYLPFYDQFTEDELRKVVEFYKSSVGKKITENYPHLLEEGAKHVQAWQDSLKKMGDDIMQEEQTAIKQHLLERLNELKRPRT